MDYSFIRLEKTLEKALFLDNSAIAEIYNGGQVRLSPFESYLQITNTKEGIAFAGNFRVYICNCAGLELQEITNSVTINEFIDNKGLPQIAHEITNIGVDFFEQDLVLKFVHTASLNVWFSNPIKITDRNKNETTRFHYKNYSEYKGIAYNRYNEFQSIRLDCYFQNSEQELLTKDYTQTNGNKVSARPIITNYRNYIFEYIDNFHQERLNCLLTHDIVYVENFKVTDKTVTKAIEPVATSNTGKLDFKLAISTDETFEENSNPFVPFINITNFSQLFFYYYNDVSEVWNLTYKPIYTTNLNSLIRYQIKNSNTWSNEVILFENGNDDFLINVYTNLTFTFRLVGTYQGNTIYSNEFTLTGSTTGINETRIYKEWTNWQNPFSSKSIKLLDVNQQAQVIPNILKNPVIFEVGNINGELQYYEELEVLSVNKLDRFLNTVTNNDIFVSGSGNRSFDFNPLSSNQHEITYYANGLTNPNAGIVQGQTFIDSIIYYWKWGRGTTITSTPTLELKIINKFL